MILLSNPFHVLFSSQMRISILPSTWGIIHPKCLNFHLKADELLCCVVGALFWTVCDAVCQSSYLNVSLHMETEGGRSWTGIKIVIAPLKSRHLELFIICTKTVLWGILQYGESGTLSESWVNTFNNKTLPSRKRKCSVWLSLSALTKLRAL